MKHRGDLERHKGQSKVLWSCFYQFVELVRFRIKENTKNVCVGVCTVQSCRRMSVNCFGKAVAKCMLIVKLCDNVPNHVPPIQVFFH